MSASDEKISNTVVNEDDDDEDEDQNDVVSSIGKNQRTKPRFGVLQRQFSKAKSKFRRIKSKRVLLPSSSLSENANSNTGSEYGLDALVQIIEMMRGGNIMECVGERTKMFSTDTIVCIHNTLAGLLPFSVAG
ncbi:PREDICTED: uncharacterized protein LOC109332208 isoform X1 [Lupinus angustifolius]|uniref:uncharacterized protein LOC109332208 isoform X1 n=1 Tax=Lupinus angustifolius TaxID=3871 RepID=UPI00092F11DD|nr:PREDICTED: uncharacterized protein LOC109332208 isoform X1 [Lupinus angustifolius]